MAGNMHRFVTPVTSSIMAVSKELLMLAPLNQKGVRTGNKSTVKPDYLHIASVGQVLTVVWDCR